MRMQARFGKGTMVIPRPLDVDALIRRVPKGKMATMLQLRQELAKRSNVDVACPSARKRWPSLTSNQLWSDSRLVVETPTYN